MDEELQEKIDEIAAKVTPESVGRTVIKMIAKHSVGFVAAAVTKTYCPTENKKQKLQLSVGAYVIGGMAGDAAADWAVREFDEGVAFVRSIPEKLKFLSNKNEETKSENPPTE